MARPKMPTFAEYPEWARTVLRVEIDNRTATIYETNARLALTTCQEHPFFQNLAATLRGAAREYEEKTGTPLFSGTEPPPLNLETKPYASALDKSYRRNALWNKKFPAEPENGWARPERWFHVLDDLVRGTLVCRYLDGPEGVAERLCQAAEAVGLKGEYRPVQQDYGYYAYHFYVRIPVEIARLDWTTEHAPVSVEIQLTTQLQEVVRDLTHKFYEEERLKERQARRDDKWKWDYKSARFKSSYLSHTLHLLEGYIAELREQARRDAGEERDEHGTAEAANTAGAPPADDPPKDPDR